MSFTLMRYKDGIPAPIKLSIWDAFKGTPPPRPAKPQPVSTYRNIEYAIPVIPLVSAMETEEIAHATETSTPTASAVEPPNEGSPEDSEPPVECACCHKVHNAKLAEKTNAKDNEQNNSHSTNEQETYSKADNKKIIAMKAENKSWDEIITAIGKKSKSQVKEHWKKINPETQDGKDDDKDDKPTNPHSANEEETYTKADNKKIIAMKKEDPGVSWAKVLEAIGKKSKSQIKEHWKKIDPDNKDKSKDKDDASESKDSKGKDKKEDSDGKKDTSKKDDKTEVGELKSWSDRYDKQKWIAAASRHFDLTGQRITPAIAKRLAEGK